MPSTPKVRSQTLDIAGIVILAFGRGRRIYRAGHLKLHDEFEASLRHIGFCLNKTRQTKENHAFYLLLVARTGLKQDSAASPLWGIGLGIGTMPCYNLILDKVRHQPMNGVSAPHTHRRSRDNCWDKMADISACLLPFHSDTVWLFWAMEAY